MRRWFPVIGILVMFLVFGCATTLDNRVADLEAKMAKVEKQVKTGLATGSGANFYPARDFTGGAAGALDAIASPADRDVAFVTMHGNATYGDSLFIYIFDAGDTTSNEAAPWIITPDVGTGRWKMLISSNMVPVYITSGRAITPQECRGGYVVTSAAGTYTLPAAATAGFGTAVIIRVRDVSETCVIAPATGEKINLTGVALAANATIQNSGVAGDYIALLAVTDSDQGGGTDGWVVLGKGGTWAAT